MNFENKIVSFSTVGTSYNHDLASPEFKEIKGRVFLTGKIPNGCSESGWSDNKMGGIAWDSVTDFIVFDSHKEYLEATEKSRSLEDNDA